MRCHKSLNIILVLLHKSFSAGRTCLLQVYRCIVHSRLDYGSIVCSPARALTLRTLDLLHHLGLLQDTGAFRTSPVVSVYAEVNEFSPEQGLLSDYFWPWEFSLYVPWIAIKTKAVFLRSQVKMQTGLFIYTYTWFQMILPSTHLFWRSGLSLWY